MAFQFELHSCTLSKIFSTNKGHWDYFVIGVPSQRIKTAFKRDRHWEYSVLLRYLMAQSFDWLEIVSTFKQQTEIPCYIARANSWTLLSWMFSYGRSWRRTEGGRRGGGLYTGRGHTRSHDFSHSHVHKQTRFVPWDCCCARLSY